MVRLIGSSIGYHKYQITQKCPLQITEHELCIKFAHVDLCKVFKVHYSYAMMSLYHAFVGSHHDIHGQKLKFPKCHTALNLVFNIHFQHLSKEDRAVLYPIRIGV